MQRQFYRKKCRFLLVLCALASGWSAAFAQTPSKEESSSNPQLQVTADVLKKVDQLVQQNEQLEKQNQDTGR